jgi:poly(3-hydroxybutyrate) depolymerase
MTACTPTRFGRRSARRLGPLASCLALLLLAGCGHEEQPSRLPGGGVDPSQLTVSGMSSGGYMAVQFHVAYSELVAGAGVLAAGPYYCAEDSLSRALRRCMRNGEDIPTDRLVEITSHLALQDEIDPIAGLARDRVWLFHGAADNTVGKPVVDALQAYYETLVAPENVLRVEHPGAGHTFPTIASGVPCPMTSPPFVGQCEFDGAGQLLAHLYGELQPATPGKWNRESLVEFDQRPYAQATGSRSLADTGWLFLPRACSAGTCRLHVIFHGCKQGTTEIGREFIESAGYLEVAEANDIVLLFPQVAPSYQPLNAMGCWDYWGYEGETYAVRRGVQLAAVRAMVADLMDGTR